MVSYQQREKRQLFKVVTGRTSGIRHEYVVYDDSTIEGFGENDDIGWIMNDYGTCLATDLLEDRRKRQEGVDKVYDKSNRLQTS
jgi:hypothetical protein